MQWQLDQRSHDPSVVSIVAGGSSTRHTKARKQRLVFRDTSSSQRQSRRLHLRHHQHTHGSGGSSSADESAASQSTVAGAATTAARDSADATSQQFYCLQLDPHAAAAQDLHKAQERLAKHMQKVWVVLGSGSRSGRAATHTNPLCSKLYDRPECTHTHRLLQTNGTLATMKSLQAPHWQFMATSAFAACSRVV